MTGICWCSNDFFDDNKLINFLCWTFRW